MSGKLFIQWRHNFCAETTRKRYMDPDISRQAHKEIVNLFFPQEETEESDESHTDEKSEKSGKYFFIPFVIIFISILFFIFYIEINPFFLSIAITPSLL